jgi:hypothetical protein
MVWDFELPRRPALKSSFGTNGDSRLKAEKLLRNRINPRTVDIADERTLIDSAGLACVSTGFWSGADVATCEMGPAPSVAAVQAEVAQHEEDLFLYNYTADEVGACPDIYEPLKAWARNLHQGGLDSLVTMAPTPQLYSDGSGSGRSAVDIWVVLPKMYRNAANRIAYVLRKGDEVWSYNCLNQDDYSPKWEIDFAPINFRIHPGFISQTLSITGLLYWRVDLWTADPWNDVAEYSPACPGEGMLVYPGEQVGLPGVVPSMRLKWLRDGVDDYDYIQLLKDRGFESWALGIAGGVGPDWEDWTRDPTELETARLLLGEQMGATFLDVFADHWAFDAIEAVSEADIVQGYPDDRYRPNRDVTRAQMAVFIARSVVEPFGDEGMSQYEPPEMPTFSDVPPTYWCYKHVELLAEENIAAGYADGRYRPGAEVTRDQMAVYIAHSIVTPRGEEGLADYVPPTTPTFADVPPELWAYSKIEYLAEEGVVSGYADGFYRPNWAVTRDQMAVYIGRAFDVLP